MSVKNLLPGHILIPSGQSLQQAHQFLPSVAQLQAAAAQQQAALGQFHQTGAQQQNMYNQLSQQYNQIHHAIQQIQAQQSQLGQRVIFNWPESKYSVSELKTAIGKKILIGNHKVKLIEVHNDRVTVDEGILFKNVTDYRLYMVDAVLDIDRMYTTKLGRLCKS